MGKKREFHVLDYTENSITRSQGGVETLDRHAPQQMSPLRENNLPSTRHPDTQ